MSKLTDSEWKVLSVLWQGGAQALGPIVEALAPDTGWSRTTVHTYLTRMMAKGLVLADESTPKHYSAAISQEDCARSQRQELAQRLYQGSAGQLVAAFVKDGSLSAREREELRELLDSMEV